MDEPHPGITRTSEINVLCVVISRHILAALERASAVLGLAFVYIVSELNSTIDIVSTLQ